MNPISLEIDPNLNEDSDALAIAIGPAKLIHFNCYPLSFDRSELLLRLAISNELTRSQGQVNAEKVGYQARARRVQLVEVNRSQWLAYEAHLKELQRAIESKRDVITDQDRIHAAEMKFDENTIKLASRLITEDLAYRLDVVGLNYNMEKQALLIGSEDDSAALRDEVKKGTRVPNIYVRKMPIREVRERIRQAYFRKEPTEKSDVKKMLDDIVGEALRRNSSDIALEYFESEKSGRVRFEIDNSFGVSHKFPNITSDIYPRLVSVIRESGQVVPGDTNKCGVGKLQVNIEGREVSLRISTVPYRAGGEQRVSMRVLSNMLTLRRFEDLGISPHVLRQFRRGMARPGGFNVIAGPAGEGKTTTAYTLLTTFINIVKKNVISIEDPIEYFIPGINQIQVIDDPDSNSDAYAELLKAMVRQKPHNLFLGEIRSHETADEAMRAATSGISLLSTTHAPDAPRVLARLKSYGVSRFDMSQNISMLTSQRLIARLCDDCKESTTDISYEAQQLAQIFQVEIINGSVMKARKGGCRSCDGSGYRDRVAAFEVLEINSAIADAIESENIGTVAVAQIAVNHGYRPMAVAALEHLVNGFTSEEAIREKLDFNDGLRYVPPTTKLITYRDPEEQIRVESESGKKSSILDNVA